MKFKSNLLLLALALAVSNVAFATKNPPNPCGNHGNNCNPTTPTPTPTTPGQSQTQTQGQTANGGNSNQSQNATGGNATGGNAVAGGGSANANGGTGIGVGLGGEGGQGGRGGDGGNASAGAVSGSSSGAISGSLSGVSGSGNADVRNTNDLTNRTNIGDVGSTSGAVAGSNSGGNSIDNTVRNGSESTSSVGDTNASIGDTSLSNGSESVSGANASNGDQSLSNENVSSADGSGNSTVNVDAADRSSTSYTAQALVIPTIQTAAPALVASPTLVVDRGVCGPRQAKRTERVSGTYVGIIKRSSIDLGVDDELVPADEPYRYWTSPNGSQHVFGHQVVTFASVNGVAASRSIGLGGGKTGGDWGQAGASSGSSVQRTILRIQLQECELQTQPAAVVTPPPYIEPQING